MNSYSDTGRTGLIRALMAKGYSARNAEKLVNAVFATMTRTLSRGEEVEIPGGKLILEQRKGQARLEPNHIFQNVQTGRPMVKPVRYKASRKVVKFVPDETLDLSPLLPAQPPARREMPEFAACRKVASQLIEKPLDEPGMQLLLQAVYSHARSPIALLQALRERHQRGYRYKTLELLAADIGSEFTPGAGQSSSGVNDFSPPSPTAEQLEALQIASQLLGRTLRTQSIAPLQAAADFPAHKPGSLLRRLRTIRDRGWKAASVGELLSYIRFHHWL